MKRKNWDKKNAKGVVNRTLIPLTGVGPDGKKGYIHNWVKVDEEDFDRCAELIWNRHPVGYAVNITHPYEDKKKTKATLMHRFIMDAPAHLDVNHTDHNYLNNRKKNLRVCTTVECCRNYTGAHKNSVTGVLGVSWRKKFSQYQVTIKLTGKTKWLGMFKDFEQACKARKAAEKKFWGKK